MSCYITFLGMKMLPNFSGPTFNFTASPYEVPANNFGVIRNGHIKWYHCREQFADAVDPNGTYSYAFVHGNIDDHIVPEFIFNVESHLKLETLSHFRSTAYKGVLWLSIAPFWKEQWMRHSLLTILLRSARNSLTYDWHDRIYTYGYAITTKLAIERFLAGYTYFTGSPSPKGWVYNFAGKNQAQVETLLVKPLVSEQQKHEEIKRIAHRKWQEWGYPHGQDNLIWEKAKSQFYGRI